MMAIVCEKMNAKSRYLTTNNLEPKMDTGLRTAFVT